MMMRKWLLCLLVFGLIQPVAGCAPVPAPLVLGHDGQPLPFIYPMTVADGAQLSGRVVARVNILRADVGASPVTPHAKLTMAAAQHAHDMAMQTGLSHLGAGGTLPVDRARAAGYRGIVLGETISETYAAELATLSAWMARADTRDVILDPNARDLGVGIHQDSGGKIWWVLMFGDGETDRPGLVPGG
jgi:uncharacterized protein YkwD